MLIRFKATESAKRLLAASAILLSGCAGHGQAPMRADSGTVDICITRATHTECFGQDAGDYADELQRHMESLEHQEEW